MDNYYIKEGGIWFGPMSEREFEAYKHDKEEIIFWKPEFCTNKILHPHFCDHLKTWVKPIINEEKTAEVPDETKQPKPTDKAEEKIRKDTEESKRQIIFHAEALYEEKEQDQLTDDRVNADKPKKQVQTASSEHHQTVYREPSEKTPGFTFKLAIILIGFLLVFAAGFYVNSKLSILFYQDIINQESVKNIEYYTRDMMNETKEIKTDIDTLNAAMSREIKALKKQMTEINTELIELKYR